MQIKRLNWRKVIAIVISLAGFLVNSVFAQNVDVYVAGWEDKEAGKRVIKVWKNGEMLHEVATIDIANWGYDSDNNIFVAGNDVYVTAQTYERLANGTDRYVGKVWKNSELLYSYSNGVGNTFFNGIHVMNGDVYVAGYERTSSSSTNFSTIAWIRKNGEIIYNLKNGDNNPTVSAMYVSGNDIYVSGRSANWAGRNLATVWKNDNQLFTFGPTSASGSFWSDSYDIAVSGNIVYASGSGSGSNYICKYDGSNVETGVNNGGAYSLAVFENRFYSVEAKKDVFQIHPYRTKEDSYESAWIEDISVKNSGRYVCGRERESDVPKVWKNGEELYALTDGTYAARALTIFVVEHGNTNINDIQANTLLFSPNPVKDELFIQCETHIDKFEIYDIAGKQILNGNLSNSKSINVSALSTGIYVLKIGDYRGKFVKE